MTKSNKNLFDKLKSYGVGHRHLQDDLFIGEKPPPRLGVYDVDEEDLCHKVIPTACNITGCKFTSDTLLDFENHYNACHRYTCAECKKILLSAHLLDLHVQEKHDSFFAVMATKKPSYCCLIEECKEKFMNPEDRSDHCIKIHKLPKDLRFDQKPLMKPKTKKNRQDEAHMEVDNAVTDKQNKKKITFTTSKQRSFAKYSGKKFVKDDTNVASSMNIDDAMSDLKASLP